MIFSTVYNPDNEHQWRHNPYEPFSLDNFVWITQRHGHNTKLHAHAHSTRVAVIVPISDRADDLRATLTDTPFNSWSNLKVTILVRTRITDSDSDDPYLAPYTRLDHFPDRSGWLCASKQNAMLLFYGYWRRHAILSSWRTTCTWTWFLGPGRWNWYNCANIYATITIIHWIKGSTQSGTCLAGEDLQRVKPYMRMGA